MPKFGVVTRAVDPSKVGKALRDGFISEFSEDKRTGLSYFISQLTKDVLKLKIGITYDTDLIEIKTEDKSENMENYNVKIKIDVPVFKPGSFEKMKVYISDLKTFKEIMKWSDKEIIFASLSRSELTELRMYMSTEQQSDLEKFIEFLYSNYGISESQIWNQLREIKMKNNESPLAFWHRLLNLYFQARGISQPSSITDTCQQKE